MRKWFKITFWITLLACGVILCAVRWQVWFGIPAEPNWTGDTLNYQFPQACCDSDQDLTILVLGDIHNGLTRTDYDTLAQRVPQAELVMQTGDWMERGQEYYRQLLLREWTHSKLMGLPVIVCPGNHDYSKGIGKTLSPIWENTFPYPKNAIRPAVPGVFYYVDFPTLRIIVLDTNPMDLTVYRTRALTWLHRVLQEAGNRYTVVLMHHPVLPAAKGRFYPTTYTSFRYALQKADLVIAGHDHSYQRRSPFIVLNTAGKNKPSQHIYEPQAADSVPVYGVLKSQITNHKSQIELRIFNLENGELIDSLHVNHN